MADGLPVQLLAGTKLGNVGQVITLSASTAIEEVAAGRAMFVSAAQPVEQQPLITVTGNYEPLAANYKILMSASGTVTLNSSLPAGTTFVIKNTSASGTVTVHPTSGLIDDQSSFSMTSGFGQLPSIEVTFDGTNWWIF